MDIVRLFLILSPVINFLACKQQGLGFLETMPTEIVAIIVSAVTIKITFFGNRKCPYCKRPLALKKVKEELISEDNVSVKVETKNRDKDYNVIGSTEQYVPGVRKNYQIVYRCKYCGKQSVKNYHRDEPDI